jgi:hypothetical protein
MNSSSVLISYPELTSTPPPPPPGSGHIIQERIVREKKHRIRNPLYNVHGIIVTSPSFVHVCLCIFTSIYPMAASSNYSIHIMHFPLMAVHSKQTKIKATCKYRWGALDPVVPVHGSSFKTSLITGEKPYTLYKLYS